MNRLFSKQRPVVKLATLSERRSALSLVEILVTVAVLVAIAAFVVPQFRSVSDGNCAFEAAGLLVSAIKSAGADSLGAKTIEGEFVNPLTDNMDGACLILDRNPNFCEVRGVTRIQFGNLNTRPKKTRLRRTFFPNQCGIVSRLTLPKKCLSGQVFPSLAKR